MAEIYDDYQGIIELDITEDGIILAADVFDYVGIFIPIDD